MITNFKIFENYNYPQIGDWVITDVYPNEYFGSRAEYMNTHVGQIINTVDDGPGKPIDDIQYGIKYDKDLGKFGIDGSIIPYVYGKELYKHNKDKEILETELEVNKYNL